MPYSALAASRPANAVSLNDRSSKPPASEIMHALTGGSVGEGGAVVVGLAVGDGAPDVVEPPSSGALPQAAKTRAAAPMPARAPKVLRTWNLP